MSIRFKIVCTCGHSFWRALPCRADLRTWDCPKARNLKRHTATDRAWIVPKHRTHHDTGFGGIKRGV